MPGLSHGTFTRTNGADANAAVYPRFFMDAVEDPVASEQNGRPIFREEERVEIIMAGNPTFKPVHQVSEEHRQRWPKEYEAFKRGQEIAVDGTPLEQWPVLKRPMVLELKALGFMTVEQVAAMSDQAMQRIAMGGRRLKELAAAFLDDAQAAAALTAAKAEGDRKDTELAALRLQIENMTTQMRDMFQQLQDMRNAPNAIAAAIPAASDPVEIARQAQGPAAAGQSSLMELPAAAPRKRRAASTEPAGA